MILAVIALAFCLPYIAVLGCVLAARSVRVMLKVVQGVLQRGARIDVEDDLPDAPAAIVTLVHGTFAPFADWTQPGSALRTAIQDHAAGPVAFRNLIWSGRNTVKGRHAASAQLRAMLESSCAQSPDTPHVVVAHSHGGNIAMTALSSSDRLRARCGVVCLSTPFLVMRPRTMGLGAHLYQIMFPFLLALLVLTILRQSGLITASSGSVPGILGALAFAGGFHWVTHRMVRHIQNAYVAPNVPAQNALLLRTLADEATIGIAAANLFGKAAHAVVGWPLHLLEKTGFDLEAFRARHENKSTVAFLAGVAVLGLAFWIRPEGVTGADLPPLPLALLFLGAGLFGVAGFLQVNGWAVLGMVMCAFSVLAFPVVAFVFLLSLAAGREMALAGAYLEMAAESSPAGRWDVVLVPEPHEAQDEDQPYVPVAGSGLQHAQSYQNPEALRITAEWVATWCRQAPVEPD